MEVFEELLEYLRETAFAAQDVEKLENFKTLVESVSGPFSDEIVRVLDRQIELKRGETE
jgi:hypothetical protein